MTVHKHHDMIIAWAKGAKIQIKVCNQKTKIHKPETWIRSLYPAWLDSAKYRIEPPAIMCPTAKEFEDMDIRIQDSRGEFTILSQYVVNGTYNIDVQL